jgi:hypothetical protein
MKMFVIFLVPLPLCVEVAHFELSQCLVCLGHKSAERLPRSPLALHVPHLIVWLG